MSFPLLTLPKTMSSTAVNMAGKQYPLFVKKILGICFTGKPIIVPGTSMKVPGTILFNSLFLFGCSDFICYFCRTKGLTRIDATETGKCFILNYLYFSGLHALFFQDYFVILQHKGFVRPCAR